MNAVRTLSGLTLGLFSLCLNASAHADPARTDPARTVELKPGSASVEALWPMPHHLEVSMDQRFADWVTNVSTNLDHGLGSLSKHVLGLRFDGRTQHLDVHAGMRFLSLDGDVHVVGNVAQIKAHLMIEAGSHALDLRLPTVELQPDDYRGERIVQLRVPLLERHW